MFGKQWTTTKVSNSKGQIAVVNMKVKSESIFIYHEKWKYDRI